MKKIFIAAFSLISAAALAVDGKCYLIPLDSINTADHEYNTVLNPDNSKMAYTSSQVLKHGYTKESALMAEGEGTTWNKSGKILSLKKKVSHIDVVAWPTEDTIYTYNGKKKSGRIQIYAKKGDKWSKIGKIKLGSKPIKKSCFNSNLTSVYFSTQRKGGLGGQDLYVSHKDEKGKWSKPVWLGEKINTKGDDIAPELVGDSLLYFASNGRDVKGGFDIYCSKIVDGEWGEPVNLGEPINSEGDDIFFTKSKSERFAYMSSSREGGKGGFDIYAISYIVAKEMASGFPAPLSMLSNKLLAGINIQNESQIDTTKVTLLKGIVMGDDSVYLKAKVALSDNKLGQVIATQEAEENGAYRIMIPGGSNYGIAVSYPGYLFHSENFELPEQNEYKEIEKDIVLKKIAIGKNVALRNLFFETNKADLSDESIVELSNVIKLLNDNPTLHIEIQGHTDNRGSKAYNQGLSERRAKSVVDYLIQHGIAPERLTSKGYGLTKPIATNKTEAGRAENRRTELLVTKI